MKRLVFAAGLFAAILCWSLHAQTINVSANIPFPFQVGDTRLPAGAYVIHNASGVLIVREQYGNHTAAAFFARREIRGQALKTGELEFNRYGSNYFLAQIWTPGSQEGLALPKSTREKELVKEMGLVQRAIISVQQK